MQLNLEQEIKELKEKLNVAERERMQAEVNLQANVERRETLLEELKTLGVRPEDLDSEIARLRKEITDLLQEAQDLLPKSHE